MKMGPVHSYLCFIPPPSEITTPPPPEEATEVTALHSWSLLQPLAGSCIYVRDTSDPFVRCNTLTPDLCSSDKAGSPTRTATTPTSANSGKQFVQVWTLLVRFQCCSRVKNLNDLTYAPLYRIF
jgi:hypothetical protein